jgi:hypothetical protein
MKTVSFILFFILSVTSFAHEGGHGELEEGGRFGGITSPVMSADLADSNKGNQAKVLYKAELVRAESGKLSLYIFDGKMNPVDLKIFENDVQAKLEVKKKGKFTYFGDFKLTKNGTHFVGQLPKVEYKPFNIDFYLHQNKQKLFVGFTNLD